MLAPMAVLENWQQEKWFLVAVVVFAVKPMGRKLVYRGTVRNSIEDDSEGIELNISDSV